MSFFVKSGQATQQQSACLIIGIFADGQLSDSAQQIDKNSKGALRTWLKQGDFAAKVGQNQILYHLSGVKANRLLLIGLGKKEELTLKNFRQAVEKAVTAAVALGDKEAHCYLQEVALKDGDDKNKMQQAIFAHHDSTYQFLEQKGKKIQKEKKHKPLKFNWMVKNAGLVARTKDTFTQSKACVLGMASTKHLANTPGNVCHPSYVASYAKKIAANYPKMSSKAMSTADLKRMKMGAYLAVAQGSAQPPKLVVMEYKGGKKNDKPVALVGKGITFDTGGLSLKPSTGMVGMKFDMCGSATVVGVMQAIAEMKLPINVVGLLVCAENMPSSCATRPDDIVTSMSGQTIEIDNTDAEGRLVLCDALTYCQQYHQPQVMIDIATLTGACVIALGSHASAVYSNEQSLADELLASGQQSLDKAWQMPLWDEYQPQLESNVADMSNTGGREAGSVTAACFLSRFVENTAWAHLDIAGTASTKMSKGGLSTGRPVPLLVQYLINKAQ